MEEGPSSWVLRAKFSHTVCHRLDCSTNPISLQSLRSFKIPEFRKREPAKPEGNPEAGSGEPISPTPIRVRSPSPVPSLTVSNTFREAISETKRFVSPAPRRVGSEVGLRGRLVREATEEALAVSARSGLGKGKSRKEKVWARFLDSGKGRVNAAPMTDEHPVDLSDLYFGTKFATGANSRLYHGVYKDEAVAVKVISQPDGADNGLVAAQIEKQFRKEVAFLSRFCHRNVLKIIGSSSKPPVFIIITEYLSGGCLRAFLHKLENKSIPLKQMIPIALDVARGMEYIHSQGVFHCDLKPENIIFDENLHAKIADFGIACEESHYDAFAGDPGTYRWMAPEMIKCKKYGRKVDVYSFGLILWEMLTGRIPYEDLTPIQAAFAVVHRDLRPTIPPSCPSPMRALIEQCWALHPVKRPEFSQVVKVLEQFEAALTRDGTLDHVQNLTCQEHKKSLLHWIQKLKH